MTPVAATTTTTTTIASATPLERLLVGTPYVSYTYSYPHKTAYRALDPAVPLREAWAAERRDALFLYLHIPFCEMRCGFCNLFTTANPHEDLEAAYLAALRRQAPRVREAVGPATFARLAIGGGTPTYLSPAAIDGLFDLAAEVYGVDARAIPVSVETSPHTATTEKLRLLRGRGVDRVSIGVQSFDEAEVHSIGRAQRTADVLAALDRIRAAGFPTLNIDLMYGLPGQTVPSWLDSVRMALRFNPEELYLYPLYVRPLTGIAGRRRRGVDAAPPVDLRADCYRAARDLLLAHGYTQVTMRMLRAAHAPTADGPVYCVQDDGMLGLGCGARSYTQALHYSTEYAVGRRGVRDILADFVARRDDEFDAATYGFRLDPEEQRRRYVIKSLLESDGLSQHAYQTRFGAPTCDDLPDLIELAQHGLVREEDGLLQLTARGLEYSDAIGPWLYSARANRLMGGYDLR